MASGNSRNPPAIAVGSVVRFGQRNSEYIYQGTVSRFKPESSISIKNVTRVKMEIHEPDDLFYFRLWELKDLEVIEAAGQNVINSTDTQADQNKRQCIKRGPDGNFKPFE